MHQTGSYETLEVPEMFGAEMSPEQQLRFKPRHAILGFFVAAVVAYIAIALFNGYRRTHTEFDSQKWKTDITSRDWMLQGKNLHPVVKGMSKTEVISLFGKPDGKDSTDKDGVFIYLMPLDSTKGVYVVKFDNDVVVDIHYDEYGDDSYPVDSSPKSQIPKH